MTDFTAHLRLPIPDFLQEPWHAVLQETIRAIDTALYNAILIQDVDLWLNATVYSIGSIVIDPQTGLLWTCSAANTSSASPTTFAAERLAHPTYWSATANIPQQRGTWVTATSYIPGDFVVDTNRYAVCLVAHVSGTFNTDLAAARWVVLIDLSAIGVGINATAEDTIASASTTNIGSKSATRLLITGTTGITSFGVVANTYKILRYQGIVTITNSANIILIGATNRTTAAGDVMWVTSDATGKWRELMFTAASGVPLGVPDSSDIVKGIIEIATQGEVDAGADTVRAVVPATLKTRLDALTTSILSTIRDGVSGTLDTLAEIATALGTLAPKASPTFTGVVTSADIHTDNLTVNTALTLPANSIEYPDIEAAAKPWQAKRLRLKDQRSSGTAGDSLSSGGTWNTRVLQTKPIDDLTTTLSSNQFTLAAGSYYIDGWINYLYNNNVNGSTTQSTTAVRLRNITDGTTTVMGDGHQNESNVGNGNTELKFTPKLHLRDYFTIAGAKTFEIQQYLTFASGGNAATYKTGVAMSVGEVEVYADFTIIKTA